MKKYEYKFIIDKPVVGLIFEQRVKAVEEEWNELGRQGWKFCKQDNGYIIFMREIDDK